MKKIFKIFMPMLAAALVACGGGGGSPGEPSGTSPLSINIPAGENPVRIAANTSRIFKIIGGRNSGGYVVSPDETGVVTASSDSQGLLTVAWVDGPKETKITVRDADNKSISFVVETGKAILPLYTTAPSGLLVGVGASVARTFTIGGGAPPYRINGSNNSVATIELIGRDQWKVTGVAMGSAAATIFDDKGAEVVVNFVVGAPELRMTPEKLTMPIGLTAIAKISGGQPPYVLAGGIPAAIAAEIKGDELHIVGSLASELDVTVADSVGQTVKIEVEINTATTAIRLSPSSSTVAETDNQNLTFTVFGAAKGEVCFFSSDPSLLKPRVVAADPTKTCLTSDGPATPLSFVVETGSQGNRCVNASTPVFISVVDAARSVGEAVVSILDNGADCGLGVFSVSPSVLNMTGSSIADVKVFGVKDFTQVTATTSNAAIATAVADQVAGVVRVKSVGPGTVTILVIENTAPRRSATVTVNVN